MHNQHIQTIIENAKIQGAKDLCQKEKRVNREAKMLPRMIRILKVVARVRWLVVCRRCTTAIKSGWR